MTSADEFLKLKGKLEALKAQYHKATGARDSLLNKLREEFGCDSVEQAREELEKLSKRTAKLNRVIEQRLEEFNQQWHEKLKSVEEMKR